MTDKDFCNFGLDCARTMVLFSKCSPLHAEHIDVISSDVRGKPKAVAMANANLLKNDAMQTLLRDLPQFVVEPTRALFACQVTYNYYSYLWNPVNDIGYIFVVLALDPFYEHCIQCHLS